MRYQRHLEVAHRSWEKYKHAAIIIDATCGNGHDTLFLTQLKPHKLYAIDLNPEAIKATQARVSSTPDLYFYCQSHIRFPDDILPNSVDLIVYNLGYLPGGDKSATTRAESTLQSVKLATQLIRFGGLISITCYPGHPEGANEERELTDWAKQLSPKEWNIQYHQWINREKSPTLLLIEKNLG